MKRPAISNVRHKSATPDARLWIAWLIVAAGAAAYANSFNGQFLLDDARNIVENERIRELWPPWPLLTARRFTLELSLAINYAISELNLWSYHTLNLLIHLAAALTLFGVVRRTLRLPAMHGRFADNAHWLAAGTALLWVVHPLTTSSVTYIIQRSESLMGLFYLLTLYCVIRGACAQRSLGWYTAAVASAALGLGAKAVMITVPVVILAYDAILLTKSVRTSLRRRWGLYLGLFATWLLPMFSGIVTGVLSPTDNGHATVGFGFREFTGIDYALTQPGVILHYLRLSLWPHTLCLDYAWPITDYDPAAFLPPLAVVGAMVSMTIWGLIRRAPLAFLGVWFFGILAPTSSIIPIRDVAFEHRMYIPLAAVVVLAVLAGHKALHWLAGKSALLARYRRPISVGVLVCLVAALGVRTHLRNRDYDDRLGMLRNIVAQRPNNARAFNNLGAELAARRSYDEAITAYHNSLRAQPGQYSAHYNLGNTCARLGRYDKAVEHFQRTLELAPDHIEARINAGSVLTRQGRYDEAITLLRKALELLGRFESEQHLAASAQMHLGSAYAGSAAWQKAAACFRDALKLRPDYYRAHYNLAQVLQRLGRTDRAIDHYRRTLQANPGHAGARKQLEALGQRP